MFVHANAALSFRQRLRLVELVGRGKTITAAARLTGCSRQTASKWVGRHRRGEGLADRSSRPHHSPRQTPARIERAVLSARQQLRAGPHPIGWQLDLAPSTVHAILRRHGQSRLNQQPREPLVRYQRERPGELLHIDVKRLGRIHRPRDPISGRPYGSKGKAGWDYLFVCVDDTTRLAHCEIYAAETTAAALNFLDHCRHFYNSHGIEIQEVLTDNGKCFQRTWKQSCQEIGITPRHTRIRRPQTNGKAERLIQTLLNEWIRPHTYQTNQHRTNALMHYLNHYNHQRRHRALNGLTPSQAVNNLPGTNTWFRLRRQPGSDERGPILVARAAEPGSSRTRPRRGAPRNSRTWFWRANQGREFLVSSAVGGPSTSPAAAKRAGLVGRTSVVGDVAAEVGERGHQIADERIRRLERAEAIGLLALRALDLGGDHDLAALLPEPDGRHRGPLARDAPGAVCRRVGRVCRRLHALVIGPPPPARATRTGDLPSLERRRIRQLRGKYLTQPI